MLAMLTNVRYVLKGSTKDREGVIVGKPVLKNNEEFSLTIVQLQALGLKSRSHGLEGT